MGTSHIAASRLSRLPTELKLEILCFLRSTSGQKSMSLVNKEWKDIVLSELWKGFSTNLIGMKSGEFLELIKSTSNVTRYMWELEIVNPELISECPDIDPILRRLLAAIPCGQLHQFSYYSAQVLQPETIQILLERQQNLNLIDFLATENFKNVLQSPLATEVLSQISEITLVPRPSAKDLMREVLERCPKLRILTFRRGRKLSNAACYLLGEVFAPFQHGDKHIKLNELNFSGVRLPESMEPMLKALSVMTLDKLSVSTCSSEDVEQLLNGLSSVFSFDTPRLTTLEITDIQEPKSATFFEALDGLLLSFKGLKKLYFHIGKCQSVRVAGIINHGSTLSCLVLAEKNCGQAGNTGVAMDRFGYEIEPLVELPQHEYDPVQVELAHIIRHCPNLRQLYLDLYYGLPTLPEGLWKDDMMPEPQLVPERPPFEPVLAAISTLRKLHTLRIAACRINRKGTEEDNMQDLWCCKSVQCGAETGTAQAKADFMMRYLVDRGCNIEVLAFSPWNAVQLIGYPDWDTSNPPDLNGHHWPHYHYSRGRKIDENGDMVTVARPFCDWVLDHPGSTVLDDEGYKFYWS